MTESQGPVESLVLTSLDYVWGRLRARCDGLTQQEYLWEPVEGCWSVHERDGAVTVERDGDPEPAPVTTIAWRLWHIGSECLANYTEGGLGPSPLQVHDREWFMDVDQALAAVDTAWAGFRGGLGRLGEDGMNAPLGEKWGPYADDSWAALVLHAQDELSHHGAEVALLRDLYRTGLRSPHLSHGPD
jgi:hypothetical protein